MCDQDCDSSAVQVKHVARRVRRGTSEYQAAWIVDSEGSEEVSSKTGGVDGTS